MEKSSKRKNTSRNKNEVPSSSGGATARHGADNDKEKRLATNTVEINIARKRKQINDINSDAELNDNNVTEKWEFDDKELSGDKFDYKKYNLTEVDVLKADKSNEQSEVVSVVDENSKSKKQNGRTKTQCFSEKIIWNVFCAFNICVIAIYASQVPPKEVPVPELVKIYIDEELNINKEFYAKHGDLAPALELVWNEVGMKFFIHGLRKDSVEVKRQQYNSRPTDQLLTAYKERVKNFETIAEHFVSNKYPVHAVIAYSTAARIEWLNNNGRETLLQIQSYTWDIFNIAEEIAEAKPINTNLITDIVTLMREMVVFVRSTESASEDDRVKYEAWCLMHIGNSYFKGGQYNEAAEENKKAIKKMDEHFGERAKTYRVYGYCFNNVGFAYERMGDYDKAKKFYEYALLTYEKVEDWSNDKDKKETEETTKTNLQNALKKVSNIT